MSLSRPVLNLDALVAIDVHTHAETDGRGHYSLPDDILSGWSPKYFPPQLVRYANGLLRRKVLFGSDFPLISPDRWLKDFADLDIKEEVRPLILRDNAIVALRLNTQ